IVGLQALTMGNIGSLLRYKLRETLPVYEEAARDSSAVREDVVRGLARAVGEGIGDTRFPEPGRDMHRCGTLNKSAACYGKGCGQQIAGCLCPSCRAPCDEDARFCCRCGAAVTA